MNARPDTHGATTRIDHPDIAGEVGEALGVDGAQLDPGVDLITQGLDSLRMMRLAGQWRKRGYDIDFARLAADPTLAAWQLLLDSGTGGADTAAAAATATDAGGVGTQTTQGQRFPLAPMQHAYWAGRSDTHAFGGVAAHLYIEFDGADIDADRFQSASEQLLNRHPMLRAKVHPDGTQSIGAPHPDAIAVHDLRTQPAHEIAATLATRRARGTHRLMPVEDGAMVRIELSLLPGGASRIHLDVDMLAADAMSYRVLVDDLARLYRGDTLPALSLDYPSLAAVRAQRLPSTVDTDWWNARIPTLPGPPELPIQTTAGAPETKRLHHFLDAEDAKRLDEYARKYGVTPASAVAAAFAEAVGSQAADPRFLLTVPMFDRHDGSRTTRGADLDRVVGDFTSSLIVDVDLTEQSTLAERARQLLTTMHAAAAHGSVGGLDVLRDLGRARGEMVISPVVFTSALGLGELFSAAVTDEFGAPTWIVSQGPQVLLDAQVTEVSGGLLLNWDVRVSDLPPAVAEQMFTYYVRLLNMLVAGNWDEPAPSPVPDTVAAERRCTEQSLPQSPHFDGTLHGGFLDRAAGRGDAPALITDDRVWSHAELAADAARVAGALVAAGVHVGDTVAIIMPKGGDQVVAALAVLIAGAAYVPIAPSQPQARRQRILSVATPAAILTLDPDHGALPGEAPNAPVLGLSAARRHEPITRLPVSSAALAYVLFTSGSTGQPKGVQVPHRAAVATLTDLVQRYAMGKSDRTLMVSSLEFDLSVFDVFAALSVGGAVVIPPAGSAERAPVDDWCRLLKNQSVTILNCVPAILGMILDLAALPTSLRAIIMGGDKVDVSLLARVSSQLPDCRVAGLGGTTETAIHSTICEAADVPSDASFVPYGRPLRGVRCRVVDSRGHDRPDLVPGELWIGGAGVADGYRGDPERSADRFVEYDGQRWYRTGDILRYLPGGFLDFLGRADHLVKIRGHRVELGEVEAGLLRTDGVSGAVVWSDGRDLRAAVTLDAGTSPITGDEIREAVAAELPEHMIPRTIAVLTDLPLTANGKYDRARIRELVVPQDTEHVVAPRTPVEGALVDILGTVLPTRPLGVLDDFIALGGDSVLATRYTAQIRDWLDVPALRVADVFGQRSVAGLAQRITDLDGSRAATVAAEYLRIMALSDDEVAAELAQTDENLEVLA